MQIMIIVDRCMEVIDWSLKAPCNAECESCFSRCEVHCSVVSIAESVLFVYGRRMRRHVDEKLNLLSDKDFETSIDNNGNW